MYKHTFHLKTDVYAFQMNELVLKWQSYMCFIVDILTWRSDPDVLKFHG